MKIGTLPKATPKTHPTERQTLEACVLAAEVAAENARRAAEGAEDAQTISQAVILERRAKIVRKLFEEVETQCAALSGGAAPDARDAFEKAAETLASKLTKLLPLAGDAECLRLASVFGPFEKEREAINLTAEHRSRADKKKIDAIRELKRLSELTAWQVYGYDMGRSWEMFLRDGGLS
jgi:hypothetical protein